jgi:hypothetical protein
MLEMIKKKLMRRYQKKRQGIREYVGEWCPKIVAKLEQCGKDTGEYTAYYAGDGLYEVQLWHICRRPGASYLWVHAVGHDWHSMSTCHLSHLA